MYLYIYAHMRISENRGYEFEEKLEVVYGKSRREKKEERNVITILKSPKQKETRYKIMQPIVFCINFQTNFKNLSK